MPRPSTIPSTPVTAHAVTMRPMPVGPSARGTTSVQSSVIDHVTAWPLASAATLRPTRRGSTAAIAAAGSG